jgi:hypothetical protein
LTAQKFHIHPKTVPALLGTLLLAAATAFGQNVPAGGGTIILRGGTLQINPAPRQVAPPSPSTPDEFDMMVASAASFDMDAPVEVQAEFDPPVAVVGGRVVYRITVSALDESLHVPDKLTLPQGLELRAGGRNQTYQASGNQKLRPMTTVIYHGTATNAGTFKLLAFDITAYGKPVKVAGATLTVAPPGAAKPDEPPRLFMQLPPGDCYVGQLLKISLILPMTADGRVPNSTQPRINGEFLFSEQQSLGMRVGPIEFDGKIITACVQDVVITPERSGAQELTGQTRSFLVRPNPAQPNNPRVENTLIDSDPVTLNVKSLPAEGVLPGFTGAVGTFEVGPPALSTNEVCAGEPLTLRVMVRGEGDLGHLTPPPLPKLGDWEGFPPMRDPAPAVAIQQRGVNVFTYTLIPLDARLTETPAIPFSYFDPAKKTYVNLTIPPVPLKVDSAPGGTFSKTPADSAAATPNSDEDSSQEKEPVFTGLLASPGSGAGSLAPLQQRGWFYAFQIIPAAVVGGLWGWDRRRRFLEQHPEVILKRQARRGLRRQLRQARRAAVRRDAAGFATAAANALRQACAPHSASHPGALVCADVLRELPATEQQGRAAEMIRRLFAAADALRFGGPTSDTSDLLASQEELETVLEGLRGRL